MRTKCIGLEKWPRILSVEWAGMVMPEVGSVENSLRCGRTSLIMGGNVGPPILLILTWYKFGVSMRRGQGTQNTYALIPSDLEVKITLPESLGHGFTDQPKVLRGIPSFRGQRDVPQRRREKRTQHLA
jgi:hypothetical protein